MPTCGCPGGSQSSGELLGAVRSSALLRVPRVCDTSLSCSRTGGSLPLRRSNLHLQVWRWRGKSQLLLGLPTQSGSECPGCGDVVLRTAQQFCWWVLRAQLFFFAPGTMRAAQDKERTAIPALITLLPQLLLLLQLCYLLQLALPVSGKGENGKVLCHVSTKPCV